MEVWLEDKKSGLQVGKNDFGDLFLGDNVSGGNLPDTPKNRKEIIQDFYRYTGIEEPVINSAYFKFFKAGNYAQYEEALEFQCKNGWKKMMISKEMGVLDDNTWVVYRNTRDLPIWLEGYATNLTKDLPFPFESKKHYSIEDELILEAYKMYFEASAPLMEDYHEFVDIFRKLNQDGTVNLEVKYNPLGFGDKAYCFMYINTFDDVYRPFKNLDDVKVFMSEEAIEKFEKVKGNIESACTLLKQLPVEFYMDSNLMNMILKKTEYGKFDKAFLQVVDNYVVSKQTDTIRKDLISRGFQPTRNIIRNILELNKITHRLNTVDEIRSSDFSMDAKGNELSKNINKELHHQANQTLELQM